MLLNPDANQITSFECCRFLLCKYFFPLAALAADSVSLESAKHCFIAAVIISGTIAGCNSCVAAVCCLVMRWYPVISMNFPGYEIDLFSIHSSCCQCCFIASMPGCSCSASCLALYLKPSLSSCAANPCTHPAPVQAVQQHKWGLDYPIIGRERCD
jgi:hypothetical protein